MRRKQQIAGQVGLACINANCISDRQQEPVGNREGVLPVASKETMESPSFMEGEDVKQRTFIALRIEPEKEMLDCMGRTKKALRGEKISWVDPGRMHITLKFLGDTDPSQVTATTRILEKTVPAFPAPVLSFRSLGIFRNIRDPRVLWIGMEAPPVLVKLKESIDNQLVPYGFERESRRFNPHLTLGRIKYLRDRTVLSELLREYQDVVFQENLMEELIYYESFLRPRGAEYRALAKIAFGR